MREIKGLSLPSVGFLKRHRKKINISGVTVGTFLMSYFWTVTPEPPEEAFPVFIYRDKMILLRRRNRNKKSKLLSAVISPFATLWSYRNQKRIVKYILLYSEGVSYYDTWQGWVAITAKITL